MDWQIVFQLILSVLAGAVMGAEREVKKKEAGLQTYSLVSLGSCLFVIIGFNFFEVFSNAVNVSFDPSRLILSVATGIGFIGAGVIILRQTRVEGITTAAGLWCAAAIGVAIGAKLYFLSFVSLILAVAILSGFGILEKMFFGKENK